VVGRAAGHPDVPRHLSGVDAAARRADQHQSGGGRLCVYDISLANFITVLGNPNVHLALANSLIACGGGTALAVIIGLTFSWVVVRTDTPCKGFISAVSMIPLFVPPLVAAVAWSILASPKTGLLNTMLKFVGIDWRFNSYSMLG
jgi:iron(III) transport system permease protein